MSAAAYYNEIDPFAAAWLRELIKANHIAPGEVDQRSIEDVEPNDLRGFTQCHFFAGIGGWSYALRLAGWPDDRQVWTGSCPCQPFSNAGENLGIADERHLWPAQFHLIEARRPSVFFGEQVTAAIKHGWLDLVQNDLEGIGYTCGAVDFPACSVGAPHPRQRLYFVGHAECARLPRPVNDARLSGAEETSLSKRGYEISGAWRQLETSPTSVPHLDGVPVWLARIVLRGYGNAIVAPQAEAFVRSYLESQLEATNWQ